MAPSPPRSAAREAPAPLVHVVDDEADVRDAVGLLLRSMGLRVATHASAAEFFDAYPPDSPGCLVLDVRLPGMSGLEMQAELHRHGVHLPVVFISGHGDIPMAVRAVRAGALDFLEKPFSDQALLDCVQRALDRDAELRAERHAQAEVRACLERLTPREREVLEHLVQGKVNKIIARELDLSTRTVEIHRARVLHKMGAANVSQLVRQVMSIRE